MRPWLSLVLLFSCAAPPAQTPPAQQTIDIPAHTQAMIDAYRTTQAQRAAAPKPARQGCPGDLSPLQLRERYLHAVGGCLEEPSEPGDPTLEVASRAQWPALYASLDGQLAGVDRCIDQAHAYFELDGVLTTRLELGADGAIQAVRTVRDDASTPDLACCVRRELRQARLPAPGRPLALEHVNQHFDANARPSHAGALQKDEIRGVISKHDPQLRACYEDAIRNGLNRGGRLWIRFVIAPNGEVPRARIADDELLSPSNACCIVGVVRGMQFPKPEGGGAVHVQYPFVFELGS